MTRVGVATGIFLLIITSASHAMDSDLYYGINVGKAEPKAAGRNPATSTYYSFETVTTLGVLVGYKVDKNLLVEGALSTNVEEGEIKSYGIDNNKVWDVTTLSVNGVYRGRGKTHLRIKVGLAYESISFPSSINSSSWAPDNNSVNLSYGIGMGFDTSSGKVFVVEWSKVSEELSIVNIGVNF